jgi:hypothetical protein
LAAKLGENADNYALTATLSVASSSHDHTSLMVWMCLHDGGTRMERSRFRTLLGIGLIVLGVIFLNQALARPMAEPVQVLPPLAALPPLPPLPALPPLPPLPALPPLPPLPTPPDMPFTHDGGWFSPPLLLIGLIGLAVMWRRSGACAASK